MSIQSKLYGKKPEYCLVVGCGGRILQKYIGTFGSVTFNVHKLEELILDKRVAYMLHSHPFGMGTQYSGLDKQVFESWAIVTGMPLIHKITDFTEVSTYVVTPKQTAYRTDFRRISTLESLLYMPWGIKL